MEDIRFEEINLQKVPLPSDYHCDCVFCQKYSGLLIRKDGSKYNKLDRNKYYSEFDSKHIAKTPLHMARYCIQRYSNEDDWIFDPTMGAGTTAVEALNQGRNVCGMELQFIDVIEENIKQNNPFKKAAYVRQGDARNLNKIFHERLNFDLIINNPPYSGDEQQVGNIESGETKSLEYNKNLPNLAFLKEKSDYFRTLENIYMQAISKLKKKGRFCIGVKDMVRDKKPYMLHRKIGRVLEKHLEFEKMILLPHYPPTLFMSTYNKRFPDVKVPRYQTILIFKKT